MKMNTIKLTKEELSMINVMRVENSITIQGLDNKTMLIKTDSTGSDAVSILVDGKQVSRCVLSDKCTNELRKFYRGYIDIYNLKKGQAKITDNEFNFIKETRYNSLFEEMSNKDLPIIFKFVKDGLFLEIRNKARTNIHSIKLHTTKSIEFRKFLLGN